MNEAKEKFFSLFSSSDSKSESAQGLAGQGLQGGVTVTVESDLPEAFDLKATLQGATIIKSAGKSASGGKTRVHVIFDAQDVANQAAQELKDQNLVRTVPVVDKSDAQFQNMDSYGEDTFFFRIHPAAYPAISQQYKLKNLKNLSQAEVLITNNMSPC